MDCQEYRPLLPLFGQTSRALSIRWRMRPEGERPPLTSIDMYPGLIPTSLASQFWERFRRLSRLQRAAASSRTTVRPARLGRPFASLASRERMAFRSPALDLNGSGRAVHAPVVHSSFTGAAGLGATPPLRGRAPGAPQGPQGVCCLPVGDTQGDRHPLRPHLLPRHAQEVGLGDLVVEDD